MTIEFSNQPTANGQLNLPALTINVDASSIREYLSLTEQLPALLVFIHPDDNASKNLVATITNLVSKADGSIFALVVDAKKSPELTQAFELNQIPSVYGLLKGQPAPLFMGDQPAEQIQMVIQRVLEVAKENGLTGRATVTAPEPEPELSPGVKSAYQAIDEGRYRDALSHYEQALAENPNDKIAEEGKAQVNLLIRLEGKDLEQILRTPEDNQERILEKADALIATGSPDQGFEILLRLFDRTPKDQREPIRLRLVELFLVVGNDSSSVNKARRALSLLLF